MFGVKCTSFESKDPNLIPSNFDYHLNQSFVVPNTCSTTLERKTPIRRHIVNMMHIQNVWLKIQFNSLYTCWTWFDVTSHPALMNRWFKKGTKENGTLLSKKSKYPPLGNHPSLHPRQEKLSQLSVNQNGN